ncbi:MAG: hypothetical protein ACXAD7_16705 [Candidatus Kariarchaeaceae archaeon]|jgi:hypothetical protein
MALPNLQYIQKVEVHGELAEVYQQFLRKLISAHKTLRIKKNWIVYENSFSSIRKTREFIFIRGLKAWAEIDEISKEDPLTKIMVDVYGENDALKWMKVVQQAVKKITTLVYSKIPELSLDEVDNA